MAENTRDLNGLNRGTRVDLRSVAAYATELAFEEKQYSTTSLRQLASLLESLAERLDEAVAFRINGWREPEVDTTEGREGYEKPRTPCYCDYTYHPEGH